MRQIVLASILVGFVGLPAAAQTPGQSVPQSQQTPAQPVQVQPQVQPQAQQTTGASDAQKSQLRQQGIQTIEQGLNLLRQSQ